ncbi:MAG: homoserine O-acetyltransferase [Gammaproteobacteria bacterium]|nr:homoserine O-acetyltransferase [Gammaproteobacteria bacterium]
MPKNANNRNTCNTDGTYCYTQQERFDLVSGNYLTRLELSYETYGNLNTEKNNIILVHHSLSMSAHASNYNNQSGSQSNPGWWDDMIGPDKPLNTNRYYIICINNLGSCFGSTGPVNYDNFPLITIHDMVISQKLLLDYLGITKIKLIIGSSMGGMLSLAWMQLYPETVENLFVAATCARAYPINIFNRMIQQEIIKANLNNPQYGLKIARMLGYSYYRSIDELNNRFVAVNMQFSSDQNHSNYLTYLTGVYKDTELYNYFNYNADKFIKYFDSQSYLCLLNAMDLYDLTIKKSYHSAGFVNATTKINISIAGITSDILFPIEQQQEIYNLFLNSGYDPKFIEHTSGYGHDAFLVEHEQFGQYIRELLG